MPLLSRRGHKSLTVDCPPPRTQHHSSSTPLALLLLPTLLPHRYPHCFQLNVGAGKKDTLLVAADTKDHRDDWIKKLGIIKQRLNETYMAGMFSNVRAGTNKMAIMQVRRMGAKGSRGEQSGAAQPWREADAERSGA